MGTGTRVSVCLATALLIISLTSCLKSVSPNKLPQQNISGLPGETEDPVNMQHSFEITKDGKFIDLGFSEIPASAFSKNASYLNYPKNVTASQNLLVEQVSPTLENRLAKLPVGESDVQRVIISFEDNLELPRFAEIVAGEPSESLANQQVLGSVVIAANGNRGPNAGTVSSPANAHKAIGVGAFDLRSGNQYGDQSRGPANDGRIKPDIQAPSFTDTASAIGSNTSIRTFCCTSGATPYAAGTAALIRNWYGVNGKGDPGRVYAYLIASGNDSTPDNTTGAGRLRVGGNARWIGGVPLISQGETLNSTITLTTPSDYNFIKAAIWWPESADAAHSDIDLFLVDPAGTVRASSKLGASVFEVARVNNPVAGNWTIRIVGKDVNVVSQKVYYFVGAQR